MPVLKVYKDGVWEELGGTSPMDGGNADTLGGMPASYFLDAIGTRVKYMEDDNAVSGSLPGVTISQVDGLREELDAIDNRINNLGAGNGADNGNEESDVIPTPTESDYGKMLSPSADGLVWVDVPSCTHGTSGSKLGGTAIFFGDSICEGYNNNGVSYVDFISQMGVFDTVIKHGVAGAGYSQYNGNLPYTSLENMLSTYANEVRNADYVFIQYGNNDGKLVRDGVFTSSDTICSKAKNCLNTIIGLNPDAHVYFVIPFRDPMNIVQLSNNNTYDMLKTAKEAAEFVASSCNVPIISMYDGSGITSDNSGSFMLSDGIHPNTAGHQRIATMIIKGINNPQNQCTYTYDVKYNEGDNLKNSISMINKLMECGEKVYLKCVYNSGYIRVPCVFHNSNSVQFTVAADYGNGQPCILSFVVSGTGTTMYTHNLTTN